MRKTLVALLLASALTACRSSNPDSASAPAPDGVSAAAAATSSEEHYAGVLPCPDCQGLDTELVLYHDARTNAPDGFELTETAQRAEGSGVGDDMDDEEPVSTEGDWSIEKGTAKDPQAPIVVLKPEIGGKTRYFARVGDRELRLLNDRREDLDANKKASLFRE